MHCFHTVAVLYASPLPSYLSANVNFSDTGQKIPAFVALTRLNKPIGILLLMWPMLWAFWFAAGGLPDLAPLIIFILGTVLTRSAGCAINDFADRKVDGHVARTRNRPLATGALTSKEALAATAVLMVAAFCLVLLTNELTVGLSFVALLFALFYPFSKRYTHFPQVVLGMAFACAVPMAFAAQTNTLPPGAWLLFVATVFWAIAYDTLYAIVDRDDDKNIGVKSTAIFFGRYELMAVALSQSTMILLLAYVGRLYDRGVVFYIGLLVALLLTAYQLWISRHREPDKCFSAFLNNNWLGLSVFIALVADYLITP